MSYVIKQLAGGPQWDLVVGNFPRRSAAEAWLLDKFSGAVVDRDAIDGADEISFMVLADDGRFYQYLICRSGADD